MKPLRRLISIVCILTALVSNAADDKTKPESNSRLSPGTYAGAWQLMVFGDDGIVRYPDKLSLSSIEIHADGSLEATFPTEAGNKVLHLQPSARELTREVWTANANGRVYMATAIPHSEATYSFRLEILRGGKLIGGAQVFCAICNPKVHLQQ